jgi:hypothetical protein
MAAMDIAIDSDGMLVIDGQRRFILGAYRGPDGADPGGELAAAGFHLLRAEPNEDALDRAQALGLWAWLSVGADPAAAVRRYRHHPALLFWETVDEPAWTWNEAGARHTPEALIAAYGAIRAEDPGRPVYMNHAPTNLVETLTPYRSATDITACDVYPVIPPGIRNQYALYPDGLQGDLLNPYISQVGRYTDKMRRVAGPGRPVFMVLQGFAWEMLRDENDRDPAMIRYPTHDETRFMAYQAIIHGAHGLVYWGLHRTPASSPFWADLRRVVGELAALEPALAARPRLLPVGRRYHEMGHSVDGGVEVTARTAGGRTWLLAANADKNPVRVTFSGLGAWRGAAVVGEDRRVDVAGGEMMDDFAPFGVHVYEMGE